MTIEKLQLEELNRVDVDQFQKQEKLPIILVLDNIRSLNNVGSAFRTGDAFSVEKIYLCGITGTPPHRDINKTALGAQLSVSWEHFTSSKECIQKLKLEGYTIIAVEQTTKSIMLHEMRFDTSKKYAFILGNEVMGVSDDVLPLCDLAIEIPQFGTKHSLNVSVSTGIVLWDYMSKLGIKKLED